MILESDIKKRKRNERERKRKKNKSYRHIQHNFRANQVKKRV